ncbi:MAG: hypothetical protein KF775_17465 [Cyclobacteriaceae bacterium]|nr:hypothetical protein [Cyclobacteriaceae bacterium]
MRKLEVIYLENIIGGDAADFADGFCAGYAGARLLRLVASVHPVTNAIRLGLDIGCAGWGIYRAVS